MALSKGKSEEDMFLYYRLREREFGLLSCESRTKEQLAG